MIEAIDQRKELESFGVKNKVNHNKNHFIPIITMNGVY